MKSGFRPALICGRITIPVMRLASKLADQVYRNDVNLAAKCS
jgi:hypothetical protein